MNGHNSFQSYLCVSGGQTIPCWVCQLPVSVRLHVTKQQDDHLLQRQNKLDGASLPTELAGLCGKQHDGRHKSPSQGLQFTAHGIQSVQGPRGLFSLSHVSHPLPPGSRCRSALILTTAQSVVHRCQTQIFAHADAGKGQIGPVQAGNDAAQNQQQEVSITLPNNMSDARQTVLTYLKSNAKGHRRLFSLRQALATIASWSSACVGPADSMCRELKAAAMLPLYLPICDVV